ncbi:hypothetical protein M885DRAFT_620646, partial [Pelagophyceae sp. CCMP2097]
MDGGGGRVVSLRAVESGLVTRLLAASTARLGAANAVRSGAWGPVDVTYLRADRGTGGRIQSAEFGQSDQPARGASGRGQRGADDFDEIYSVDLGTHTVLAARRTAHEDFSVFASSKAAAAALVEAGGFRVRATASAFLESLAFLAHRSARRWDLARPRRRGRRLHRRRLHRAPRHVPPRRHRQGARRRGALRATPRIASLRARCRVQVPREMLRRRRPTTRTAAAGGARRRRGATAASQPDVRLCAVARPLLPIPCVRPKYV